MTNYKDLKMIFGIDSLYYFCESTVDYDDLYLDILDQIDIIKGNYARKEIAYQPSNITINISDTSLTYLGFSEGFIWFRDLNSFFKIGFKDHTKNRALHNIRVQLLGEGIYTIGIKSLIDYIDTILGKYTNKLHPVTRADLNCFIEYDFSWVSKNMFATRKKSYSVITEMGNANKIETIYVGKNPFKLRLYNKSVEMIKSKKADLMREFFLNHDFDMNNTIFNVEFEMHRAHLKTYNIATVEDVLSNANNLFKRSMEDIRLIDSSEVTQNDIEHNNKHRATTLPIWNHIKDSFDIKEVLQIDTPLERIKRVAYSYDYYKFKEECMTLLRKAHLNSVPVRIDELKDCLYSYLASLEQTKQEPYKKDYVNVEVVDKEGVGDKFRLLKTGEIIKPINVISVKQMSDFQLINCLDELTKEEDRSKFIVAYNELVRRGLREPMPF